MHSALQVLTAPTVEPVDVPTARKHLRVDHFDDDDLIAMQITAARSWAEMYLGRALAQQQLRWTMSQQQPPPLSTPYVSLPLSVLITPMWFNPTLLQQRNGGLELPRQPVVSVDAVSFGVWGQSDTVLTTGTDFVSDPGSGRLLINPSSWVYPSDHLQVDFTTGYGSDPTLIPAPVRQAILLITAHLYEHRGDASEEIPQAAGFLLAPYRLITFGG